MVQLGKKKIVVLPSSGISEYMLVGQKINIFLIIFSLKSTQKVQNLDAFSAFFLKKGEKTSNLT